jgi:NTP pyrophosphatase (non-canonical NTP hydrolase)
MKAADYQREAERTNLPDYGPVQARMSDPLFARLLHAASGMVTEAGEFMDALKKHAMYGKPLDVVNLAEEVGDQLWYLALACNTLGVEIEAVMATNIEKLRVRFPEKFTEKDALTRDLGAERRILEGK